MTSVSQGSLRERGKGKWQARFHVIENGESKMVSRTFEATSKRAATEIKNEIRESLMSLSSTAHGDMRLADYLEEYKTIRLEAGLIERSTSVNYEDSSRRVCRHIPGDPTVSQVTADSIQAMLSSMIREGLHPNTIGKDFRYLKQVMLYAEDMGHIAKTPFNRSLKPPRRRKPLPNALTVESRVALMSALEAMPVTRLRIAIKLGVLEGLRREEVCGLRWDCVSFEASALVVATAIGIDRNVPYIKDPKTESSRRTVPLEPGLEQDLKDLAFQVVRAGRPLSGFVLGEGERFWSPIMLTKEFSSLSRALGLVGVSGERATFHDLRHTFATTLLDARVSPKTVADLLGHADPAMTLRVYTSTTEVGVAAARAAIGELASGSRALPAAGPDGTRWNPMGPDGT